ncbi:MAG TPA: hypothetical protein VJW76_16985 [Verrucomicrobiae bacterium]|nr:hypothetical protein [Verrucomicrobiae bacterium]
MLGLNFGATFDDDTPLEIFARNNLSDGNLMGSGGLYQSLGAGPAGLSGAPAFVSGTEYTLEFLVVRTSAGSVDITTALSGGGTNWSLTVTDNTYRSPSPQPREFLSFAETRLRPQPQGEGEPSSAF